MHEKAEDVEAETECRGEEFQALATAKKVISEATGGAEDIPYGLNQVSFFQRSRLAYRADLARSEAVNFIRYLGRKQDSPMLAQLASRMDSAMHFTSGDPFAKVKGQIPDTFLRLEYESAAGAIAKAYCVKELSETEAEKANKDTDIAKLSTSIDQMSSKSAQLKEQVAALKANLERKTQSRFETFNVSSCT